MTFGVRQTFSGARVHENLGLKKSTSDEADSIAARFGEKLLLRVDPRDIGVSAAYPTGIPHKVHEMAPNGDGLFWQQSGGVAVAPVAGLYNGETVLDFNFDAVHDVRVAPRSMNTVQSFTVVGVAHMDSALQGQADIHGLIQMFRDGSELESSFYHQHNGGVEYLVINGDFGPGGGGGNFTITGNSIGIAFDQPFVFVWVVEDDGQSRLMFNQTSRVDATSTDTRVPETGSVAVHLGRVATSQAQQWVGGLARAYFLDGDTLVDPTEALNTQDLVGALMAKFGVS